MAEAAAHAAILALHDDFNGTNFKEKIGSCTGGNTRHEGNIIVLNSFVLILFRLT